MTRYKHVGTFVLLDGRGFGDLLLNPNMVERAIMAKLKTLPNTHALHAYKARLSTSVDLAVSESHLVVQREHHQHYARSASKRNRFLHSRWALSNWDDLMNRVGDHVKSGKLRYREGMD